MMYILFRLLNAALSLFDLALFIYVILSWVHPAANRWTELLRRIVEPVLTPIRRFLVSRLPGQWMMMDWSPVVAWILISVLRRVLVLVFSIFL